MAAKWLQWVYLLLLLQGVPPRKWIAAESAWGEVADVGEVAGEVVVMMMITAADADALVVAWPQLHRSPPNSPPTTTT